MAVTIRINEDNYQSIKELAAKERRSVVGQLDKILDEYFHRDTVGTPILEYTPSPKKIEPETPVITTPSVADLIRNGDLKPGTTVKYTGELSDPDFSANESECCQHPIHPCKHWVWDIETGEGYRNTLSGRYREAD